MMIMGGSVDLTDLAETRCHRCRGDQMQTLLSLSQLAVGRCARRWTPTSPHSSSAVTFGVVAFGEKVFNDGAVGLKPGV